MCSIKLESVMAVSAEIVDPILEMAIGHGLVDDLLQQEMTHLDVLDLINRLLLADAIDTNQAISLIKLVTVGPADV